MGFLKKHKNDIILILAVLILAGGAWLYTRLSRETGAEVVVSVDGEELHRLSLFEDTELIGYLPRADATTIIETLDFDQFSDKIQVIDGAIWRVDTQQPVLIQEYIPPESPLPLIMNCVIAFCGLYVLTWCTGALTEKIQSRKKSS